MKRIGRTKTLTNPRRKRHEDVHGANGGRARISWRNKDGQGGRDGRNRPSKPEANRVTSRSLKTKVSIRDNSSSGNETGYALVGNGET